MAKYGVIAEFSNGRISEHEFETLEDARDCALRIEAGSFAQVTVYVNRNAFCNCTVAAEIGEHCNLCRGRNYAAIADRVMQCNCWARFEGTFIVVPCNGEK